MEKFIVLVLLFVFCTGFVSLNPARAIPVSPDKYFFELSTNESKSFSLNLLGKENLTGNQSVFIYVLGMKKTGEENDRQFYIPDPKQENDIANWIELNTNSLDLKKGDVKTVTWSIKNRGLANCGTNLAAIVVSESPRSDLIPGNTVALKNEIISQIHVQIKSNNNGECVDLKYNTRLIEFSLDSKTNSFDQPQVPFITRVQNEGNLIQRSPKGFIDIFQGGRKIETIEFNPGSLDIYPNTVRRFENIWVDKNYPYRGNYFDQLVYEIRSPRFGYYEARLGITKNSNPEILSTVSFWIIPWRIITLFGIILISTLLVFLIVRYSNYRKKKGRI